MNSLAGKIFFAALSVLYPVLVFCGIRFWGVSPRKLSLVLLLLAAFHFFSISQKGISKISHVKEIFFALFLVACGGTAFALDNAFVLKFYPVLVNAGLLVFLE